MTVFEMVSLSTKPVKLALYNAVPNTGAGAVVWYLLLLSERAAATGVHVLPPSVLCWMTIISCATLARPVIVTPVIMLGNPAYAICAGGERLTE